MNKPSILTLALVAALAAGSAQAALTKQFQPDNTATQVAKKGADDRQKDDRGGRRLSDDSLGEQVAREGGVRRGKGRGI